MFYGRAHMIFALIIRARKITFLKNSSDLNLIERPAPKGQVIGSSPIGVTSI